MKQVDDMLELGSSGIERQLDVQLETDGWRFFEEEAKRTRDRYVSHLQSLLDTYGVENEAALVSGHMTSIKNRVSERDKDDFSYYNTDKLIEIRYSSSSPSSSPSSPFVPVITTPFFWILKVSQDL